VAWFAANAGAEDAAPPARAVRLSNVDGHVQLSRQSQVLSNQAVANVPLFEGTNVTTGDDGRAEIQFEDGSVARISPDSSVTLTVLRGSGSSAEAEVTLNGGLGYFELQGTNQAGQIRVHFGNAVVTAGGFTVLRIELDSPPGQLAVFSGNAHMESGTNPAVDLHGGETVDLRTGSASGYTISESIEPDSWDTWNSDRDQVLTAEAAAQTGVTQGFVNSQSPAWNDLDANGTWYNVPGQGEIWSPYEAANSGWDPYGYGFWSMTPGYGYVWASGYPWGFLPYLCGMWNYYDDFGWGWAPGIGPGMGFGGCMPWWGMGFYGGANIGRAPIGYPPPRRPMPPRHGIGHGPGPVIAVNRTPLAGGGVFPARDGRTPVTIAGHSVMPAQPLHVASLRPGYERTAAGVVNHANTGSAARIYSSPSGGGQARGSGGSHPASSSASKSSGSGSSAGGSHASSGGGGGGGTAAGGGGGSHAGGGGGGHH